MERTGLTVAKDNRQKKAQIAAKKAARAAKKLEKKPNAKVATKTASTPKASTASAAPRKKSSKKKKNGAPVGKIIVAILALLLVVAVVVFIILGIKFVKNLYKDDDTSSTTTTVDSKERDDVAYYLLGLMGKTNEEKGTTGTTQMLSLVCYDKHAKTINVLQVPPSTYLGDEEHWKVSTVGKVWSNPMPLLWCEQCRRQVYAPEIKGGKHNITLDDGTACNTKITKKTGSSVQNLLEVFSYQYTIPIDNYYIIPQEGLVELVDSIGGIDVKLGSAQTLGDISYESGVQTLDGAGALEYILGDYDSINGQVSNMVHQRQAIVAIFERLMTMDEKALEDDVIYPLMKGSSPIRTKRDNEIGDDITLMVKLLKELNKIERSSISLYVLPGERASADGSSCYSVHKDELCKLLNDSFNPYDTAISEEFLRMTELSNSEKSDLQKATYADLLVKQAGILEVAEEEAEE